MKKLYILMLTILSLNLFGKEFVNNEKIGEIFKKENATGTIVIYDVENNKYIGFNEKRANKRYQPASTFKIFNSLIGLSTGAVKNVDEVFYIYDGSKMFLKSWENDMSLRSGIKVSHVPAFKQLARTIGKERMQENIKKLGYGNEYIGNEVDTFWLKGPLKINAKEQAEILAKLAKKELSYPKEIQEKVAEITVLETGKDYVLHGKTGWATDNVKPSIGWFVGWVEKNNKIYTFAINMDLDDAKNLPLREKIVKESLKEIGILN